MFQDIPITAYTDAPDTAGVTHSLGDMAAADSMGVPMADVTGMAAARDIFGDASQLVIAHTAPAPAFDWVLTGGVPYSLAVVMCLIGLCTLVYYFRTHAVTVVNIFRGTLYIEKLLDEHNYIFETFRKLLILTGICLSGLVLVRYCDYLWGGTVSQALPWWGRLLPVPAVWVALGVVWFFQNLVLRLAGWLTYSGYFTSDLISLRNLGYGLVFILCFPLLFSVVLAPEGVLGVLSWILAGLVGFLLIFVLIRTYMLFIRQKISILYWFLYLCAVEILPVSFLVVLGIRSL